MTPSMSVCKPTTDATIPEYPKPSTSITNPLMMTAAKLMIESRGFDNYTIAMKNSGNNLKI